MDFSKRLSMSYYKEIAVLNNGHNVCLVQHQETQKIYVRKILDVYNSGIYHHLQSVKVDGIPKIIEFHEENSVLTLVEEYISGETLQDKINAHSLTLTEICIYMEELCTILAKLHRLNPPIIHRDIKPENIIITSCNHVVLIDFNAAKYFTDINTPDTILLGTKGYAAPEQYGFGSSTQQTDIYALGVLLKEMVSSIRTSTQTFDNIIEKCMQINPADRFVSVSELQKKLPARPITSNTHFRKIEFWKSLIPPGFRTGSPWHMIIASIVYLFIFALCLQLEVENSSSIVLWIERIFCLLIFLSIIFTSTNYLNIQKMLPLCQNKFLILRFLGIIILDITFASALMITMLIIVSFS